MAKMGKFDASRLKRLQAQMKKELSEAQQKEIIKKYAQKLAQEFFEKVKDRTPVGNYSGSSYVCNPYTTGRSHKGSKSGKRGGTLRDSWSIGDVRIEGNRYIVEVINDAKNDKGHPYASYVEFGHRKANGEGWVDGHFMMEVTKDEVENKAPKFLERALETELAKAFGGCR